MTISTLTVDCRRALGVTQEELGDLLGRHSMTISYWERGGSVLMPDAYRTALMVTFIEAALADPTCGRRAVEGMKAKGVAYGLYVLLSAAFT